MRIFNIFKTVQADKTDKTDKTVNRPPEKRREPSLADCKTGEPTDAAGNRRIVGSARTIETINEAARSGFRPLVKPVQPNKDVHFMLAVFQSPETGEIEISSDMRWYPLDNTPYVRVMGYTHYYPYHFPEPFAAYLLPSDLAVGEEVLLEDLIEDLVAVWGNQGYHPRLEAAPAIWTGKDFEILFDPEQDARRWIG